MTLQNKAQIYDNNVRTVTGSTSVLPSDVILNCDTTVSGITLELLTIPTNFNLDYRLYVVDYSGTSETNNIIINVPPGYTINGESSIVINKNFDSRIIRFVNQNKYSSEKSDYVSNITLSGSSLLVDGVGSAFNGTVDLSSLGQTGSTLVPLIYNQSLDAPNTSIQPAFGTSTIDSGSTYSSILGGQNNIIIGGVNPFSSNPSNTYYSSITSGRDNRIERSWYSSIGSGYDNRINFGFSAEILGGNNNEILYGGWVNSIVGGYNNKIRGVAGILEGLGVFSNFIGNGSGNSILTGSSYSSIIGGRLNSLIASQYSIIGGGRQNTMVGDITGMRYSSILNGRSNEINLSFNSTIIGGRSNEVVGGTYSSIVGGRGNQILGSTTISEVGGTKYSFIGNGRNNLINSGSTYSSIVGGKNNTNSGYNSLIGGGDGIVISGNSLNYSNIVNGKGNIITSNSSGYNLFYHNSIINGKNNGILNAYASEIIGGFNNNIQNGILTNSIVGGQNNYIGQPSFNDGWDGNFLNAKFALGIPTIGNFIGNGWGNRIESNAFSAILGGLYNRISGTTNDASSQPYGKSTIVGGMNNQIIGLNSAYSSILGGQNNLINNINNVHIIGSNITSISANTTHVNNLNIYNTPVTDNSLNDLLVRDTNGQVRVRQASSFTGGTSATTATLTTKFAITTGFTQDVILTINHGFNLSAGEEYDIVVKLRDIDNNIEIAGVIDNFQSNDVDITLSQTYTNVRVVIIA
jgi:hypothetical protein